MFISEENQKAKGKRQKSKVGAGLVPARRPLHEAGQGQALPLPFDFCLLPFAF